MTATPEEIAAINRKIEVTAYYERIQRDQKEAQDYHDEKLRARAEREQKEAQQDEYGKFQSGRSEAQQYHDEKLRARAENVNREQDSRRAMLRAKDFIELTGVEFEDHLKELFEEMGYTVTIPTASADQGVDLILSDSDIQPRRKIAVQAKCYSGLVGNEAVQQVFAGARHYGCKVAIVVASSAFTNSAIQLAKSTGVKLIDGKHLGQLTKTLPHQPF